MKMCIRDRPVGAVCRVIVQHGGNKMIQQKIENDLSGQLQFQDTGRIEGKFPHGPFQNVNGDGVIGSFKQITAVGSGQDVYKRQPTRQTITAQSLCRSIILIRNSGSDWLKSVTFFFRFIKLDRLDAPCLLYTS